MNIHQSNDSGRRSPSSNSGLRWATTGILTVMLAVSAAPAMAQENSGTVLDTIIVTANRRAEDIQSVPIAISAFTATELKSSGVSSNSELFQRVPGLEFNRVTQGAQIYLRGVGTFASAAGAEPGVATYVDDVYRASSAGGLFEYNSIEALEVLKGPQGTLFGRNSTGGVVNIRTKNPGSQPALDVNVGYANYDTYSGQFYGNMPLSETVAVNLAAHGSKQKEGWGTNFGTGNEVFKGWSYGFRGKLQFQPTDMTTIVLAANVEKARTQMGMAMRPSEGVVSRGDFRAEVTYPGIGFYDGTSTLDSNVLHKSNTYSAKITHDLDALRLVSITAYDDSGAIHIQDVDATPTPFFHAPSVNQFDKTFTQEFQVLSADDARIQWIVGAYYLKSKANYTTTYTGAPFAFALSTINAVQRSNSIAGFAQASMEVMPKTNLTAGLRYTRDRRTYNGSASWNASTPPIIAGPYSDKQKWSKLTMRASLDHHFTDDVMGYVAFNTGFKSGIYNLSALSPTPAPAPVAAGFPGFLKAVDPEKITAYTAGAKMTGFNGRVRLNVEGFYYDYKNIQVQLISGTTVILVNGSSAKIKGADFTLTAEPIDNLTLNAGLTVQDGEYGDFANAPVIVPWGPLAAQISLPPGCGIPPAPYPVRPTTGSAAASPATQISCNLKGNKTARTPPFSTSLSANYRVPTNSGPFDLNVSWAHGGDYYFDADNNQDTKQPTTDVVNASLQWTSVDSRYNVKLWVRNLTKQKYFSYAAVSSTTYAKYSPQAPRTFGINFGLQY